jgi:hypothetical protein
LTRLAFGAQSDLAGAALRFHVFSLASINPAQVARLIRKFGYPTLLALFL